MCIIAVKCKGADFAPLSAIKNCVDSNPHGFGMAWNQDGAVKTFRTMDPAEAIARYHTLSTTLDPARTALLFHARIATHGSKKLENCHCWTYGDTVAFAHNGILHNIPARDDMTDSETFFRDYFIPAVEGVDWEYALKLAKAIVAGTHNKLALIDSNGGVWLTGDYVKESFSGCRGKIYFSNTSYRPRFFYPLGTRSNSASLSTGRSRPAPKDSAMDAKLKTLLGEFQSDQPGDRLPF